MFHYIDYFRLGRPFPEAAFCPQSKPCLFNFATRSFRGVWGRSFWISRLMPTDWDGDTRNPEAVESNPFYPFLLWISRKAGTVLPSLDFPSWALYCLHRTWADCSRIDSRSSFRDSLASTRVVSLVLESSMPDFFLWTRVSSSWVSVSLQQPRQAK